MGQVVVRHVVVVGADRFEASLPVLLRGHVDCFHSLQNVLVRVRLVFKMFLLDQLGVELGVASYSGAEG